MTRRPLGARVQRSVASPPSHTTHLPLSNGHRPTWPLCACRPHEPCPLLQHQCGCVPRCEDSSSGLPEQRGRLRALSVLLAWPWKGPPHACTPGVHCRASLDAERMTEHKTEILKGRKTGETKSADLAPLWVTLVQRTSAPTACPTLADFHTLQKLKGTRSRIRFL